MIDCPLCKSRSDLFSKDKRREYYKCVNCDFIFVPENYHLTPDKEIERYKLHTNSKDDPRYIAFLNRIVPIVTQYIKKGESGIDFGCGPSPILPESLEMEGLKALPYDPIFYNNIEILEKKWDFIVSTEVFEHFNNPLENIYKIWRLIKKGGYLFIMTQLYSEDIEFKSWYYKGDQTHIGFYTKKTFEKLALKLDSQVNFYNKDIIVLRKV